MTVLTTTSADLDSFAAERDEMMVALATIITPAIVLALQEEEPEDRTEMLNEILRSSFDMMFADLGGVTNRLPNEQAFLSDMREALDRLVPDGTDAQVERLANWFATAALGAATLAASPRAGTKTWVTMRDDAVREAHVVLAGETVDLGDKFMVGESQTPTEYPGQPVGPVENWINCRCVLRVEPGRVGLAAAGGFNGVIVAALPQGGGQVTYADGDSTELHQTIAYLGTTDEMMEGEREAVLAFVERLAAETAPFTAFVAGKGTLGKDQDEIVITESPFLQHLRDVTLADEVVGRMAAERDTHPTWISHVTGAEFAPGDEIIYDRVGAWFGGDDHHTFELGGVAVEPEEEVEEVEIEEDPSEPPVPAEPLIPEDGNIPVYGVAVPEGVESGDGRMFAVGSLSHRDLPLPLTWQRAAATEHEGEVVVGRLDVLELRDGLWHYSGELLGDVPETEEVISLIAQQALRGVSIAADSGQVEQPTPEQMEQALATGVPLVTTWNKARISGLTIVQIPAFQESFIALGIDPELAPFVEEEAAIAADGQVVAFKRGPGWITNPEETNRIHNYWTRGEGAAKIRWGTSGDFTRCTRHLRKYIEPRFLNRTCAEWHHDALGYWPGEKGKPGNPPKTNASDCTDCEDTAMIAASADFAPASIAAAPALSLVAAAPVAEMPRSWLDDPKLPAPTPLTVLASGQVFGHIAKWGTCHIGLAGQCITPPTSPTDYAYYHLGEVETDQGRVACGSITLGTGHADLDLAFSGTKAHYDNTGTVVAKVRAGEDEHGIWIAGGLCDGVTDAQRRTLMAAGGISGDWRKIGGHLELVAGLAVNVPGFPVPRIGLAASAAEGQTALVAAGVVVNASIDVIADAVIARMAARDARQQQIRSLLEFQRAERLALISTVEV